MLCINESHTGKSVTDTPLHHDEINVHVYMTLQMEKIVRITKKLNYVDKYQFLHSIVELRLSFNKKLHI